ncbi:MAG: Glycosyltransferase, partial [uncultured Chloroflexia bacterium]
MPEERPIWIYLPYADEQAAGMQRYASQMIKALRKNGVAFELIVGEVHGHPAWLKGTTHRIAIRKPLARLLPRALLAFLRLLWLQTIFSFVIGRRGGTLLALAHELPPFPRIRQVAVAHDLTDFKSFAERGGWGTRARNALWGAGLKRSAQVIAISEATRRDLLEVFKLEPSKVHVVYEGVDTKLFNPEAAAAGQPAERPFLLYAGTLDPHKNLPFLLDVFADLRSRIGYIDLKLVGRHNPQRVAALLQGVPTPFKGNVDFVGFVPDEVLASMMAGCSAFVFPSRNEGFGLAPVEAMACGAPVLAADAGSLPEVIGAGGVLLPPEDAEAWLDELERTLTDAAYRE